jgi:HEAT repeat protein
MSRARILGIVLALGCPGLAQDGPVVPPDADLETIQEWAASRLASRSAAFKALLLRAMPMLQSSLGDETTAVKQTIARLAAQAPLYPGIVLEAMKADASPVVRRRLAAVLAASGDPALGPLLLESAVPSDEGLAQLLIETVGRLNAKESAPALLTRLAAGPPPGLTGEIVLALARLGAPEALPEARRLLAAEDAGARAKGATALGLIGSGREDVDALRKLATGPDPVLRATALRSLGRFKADLDALRTLHDAVVSSDLAQASAALDGIESAGTKELSPHFLLQVVKAGPVEVRERAARVMLHFGNAEGARILVQPEKLEADKAPTNRNVQAAAGDRCRELGWYEGALPFYDRALAARKGTVSDQQILVAMARCHARLKRFEEAKRKLRSAHYASFGSFAEDPDFQEMKELPAYREAFK